MAVNDIVMGAAGTGVAANYIDDVFSNYTYVGNGASYQIDNNVALGNGATSTGFINELDSGLSSAKLASTAMDSLGNVYCFGLITTGLMLFKYNSAGTIQYQKRIVIANGTEGTGIFIDSADNLYLTGKIAIAGVYSALVMKCDLNGSVIWQKLLSNASSFDAWGQAITADSSGNVYITGTMRVGTDNNIITAKYNSSGALQWQRTLGTTFGNELGYGIVVDSSGNVIVTGTTINASYNELIALKYNSSGVLQWQRKIDQTGYNLIGYNVKLDASNNIIIVGTAATTGRLVIVLKIATATGNKVFQTDLTVSNRNIEGFGFDTDTSGNIYVTGSCGTYGSPTRYAMHISKFTSSGVIVWSRQIYNKISQSYAPFFARALKVSGSSLYISGDHSQATAKTFLLKLPTDGSGIGNYGNFVYTDHYNYQPANTYTYSTPTFTDTAGAGTEATPTYSFSTSSYLSYITAIPLTIGKGGLTWIKQRTGSTNNNLFDTVRGATKSLHSNTNANQITDTNSVTSFNGTGFSMGSGSLAGNEVNASTGYFGSWSFAKQPKFFDIVTWTGNGGTQSIAHNLGSAVGMIIVKKYANTSVFTTSNWAVWHRSQSTKYAFLNTTTGFDTASAATVFGNNTTVVSPSSTSFTVGNSNDVNQSGDTYIAYLFAHDAGGFGATGADNVISCGTYTGNGSTAGPTVTLGYEPQWVMIKNATTNGDWVIHDSSRGLCQTLTRSLNSNSLSGEPTGAALVTPNATGFTLATAAANYNASSNVYIYVAIRRPMKIPTLSYDVYTPINFTATAGTVIPTNFQVDMQISRNDAGGTSTFIHDTMRGLSTISTDEGAWIATPLDMAETTGSTYCRGFNSNQFLIPAGFASATTTTWNFKRASGFFDIVCYTGNGSNRTVAHNLTVIPELIIVKSRSATGSWQVYSSALANTEYLELNTTAAKTTGTTRWNSTTPTISVFSLGTATTVNTSSATYVAYLFATVAGVSKVGSYTGNGTNQTIACGFTTGARFIMIKRTDSTGDWYVWDSANGIVAGNDPHFSLNTSAAEVTTDDSVDPDNSGFIVNQLAATNINVTSATYIYLAIA